MRLSCTVTEIWGLKDNGVTSLTFWDHVTSSVTWPSTRYMWFPIGGALWSCVYLAQLRRYKALKWHLPMLKAKSSLRMRRVTWTVGRRSKITAYLKFPRPHCLITMPLWWGYDDD